MPRTVLKGVVQRNGAGIYGTEQRFDEAEIECEFSSDITIETEANETTTARSNNEPDGLKSTDQHSNSGDSNSSGSLSDSNYEGKLQATQQVLDVLDQQINTLNELNKQTSETNNKLLQIDNYNHQIDYQLPAIRQRDFSSTTTVTQGDSESSNESREFLLNNYIRHSIDETGECGCHFEVEPSDPNRLKEEKRMRFYVGHEIEVLEKFHFDNESSNSLSVVGNHRRSGSEYSIGCNSSNRNNAQQQQRPRQQLSIDSDDEDHVSLNVCSALRENRCKPIGSLCERHDKARLLIEDRQFERNPELGASDEFERDSEQQDTLRANTGKCVCAICVEVNSDEGSSLLVEGADCCLVKRGSNNNHLRGRIETPNRIFGSINENFRYATDQNREQKFSISSLSVGDEDDRESCPGECFEFGNALEGIIDNSSLNGEQQSPSPKSPLLTKGTYSHKIQTKLTKPIADSSRGSTVERRPSYSCTCKTSAQQQQQYPSSLSDNNSDLSLSWSQEFQLNNNNNNICAEDKQYYLRKQLYHELSAKLNSHKLKSASWKPEDDTLLISQAEIDLETGPKLTVEGPRLVSDHHHPENSSLSSLNLNETPKIEETKFIFRHEHNTSSGGSSTRRDERFEAPQGGSSNGSSTNNLLNYYHGSGGTCKVTREKSSSASNKPFKTLSVDGPELCCETAKRDCNKLQRAPECSMKTVKDIAKISIPSLASLQFLPNQIDTQKRNKSRLRRYRSMDVSGESRREPERGQQQRQSQVKPVAAQAEQTARQSVRVIEESREDIQHEPSLLHNLCLCSCMAKSHNGATNAESKSPRWRRGDVAEGCNSEIGAEGSLRDLASSPSEKNKTRSKKSRSLRSLRPSEAGSSRHSTDGKLSPSNTGSGDHLDKRHDVEKQSPSFQNLLKSSAHISHSFRHHPAKRVGVANAIATAAAGGSEKNRRLDGNSVGDLEATESCCSSGRNSSLDTASGGGSFSGSHSASFVSGTRAREDEDEDVDVEVEQRTCNIHNQHQHGRASSSGGGYRCDSASPSLGLLVDPNGDSRAQSACSTREEDTQVEQPKRGFSRKRRFQSFFSGSSSHGASLKRVDESEQQHQSKLERISKAPEPKGNKREKKSETNQQQESFFTRSLNRLSYKRRFAPNERKYKTKITKNNQENEEEEEEDSFGIQSTCVSPTISISTVNSKREDNEDDEFITDSINSLEDELILPEFAISPPTQRLRSSSLLKPGIVFDRVKYTRKPPGDISDIPSDSQSCLSSATSYDMTRSRSCKTRQKRQHLADNGSCTYGAERIARYGSEISNYTSDNGTTTSERACSLPASPHGFRRDLCSGQNRSPRLTQSPVPFPSPATESTKIEDGLKVCSTEHFEKHIGNIKGNQIEAQKKLFKAWINHYCPNLIQRDLVDELRDGIKLIGLLATLTRDKKLLITYDKLNRDKQAYINRLVVTPSSRLRHVSNVSIAIEYLRKSLGMKMINLNPMDVVSGKPNVTLGLCWNIILNFQLEQNFLGHLESSSELDSFSQHSTDSAKNCTSRFSSGVTNEDCARKSKQSPIKGKSKTMGDIEDYSLKDLVGARKRLLDHINKRFNLKLTNLTSNLLDADVLSIIIKQLAPQVEQHFAAHKDWKAMSNDEKLDHCFHMAQEYLQIPQLFSASDLKYQFETDNNSKPLLVYLSMLLKAPSPEIKTSLLLEPEVNIDLAQQQEAPKTLSPYVSAEIQIRDLINEIDTDDKYELGKLQATLTKVKDLKKVYTDIKDNNLVDLGESLLTDCKRLIEEAQQVEDLISWINQVDNLFETKHKSHAELTDAIDQYRKFFSTDNIPQVKISLCPTLERQYRECLGLAKQRVLLMEQTLKNWDGYEKARGQLKEWLSTAEMKLSNALRSADEPYRSDVIDHHTERLEDLIDYFELEPIESILMNETADGGPNASFMNYRLPSLESLPSSLLSMNMNESISGSVLSIGSTSSRMSTLQCSKKATYNMLFEEFELKCRLLATQLDSEQRDVLLMGVRELKYRLRHITEQRVPQVVSELKFNISRCEMSIEEQDEEEEDSKFNREDLARASVVDSSDEMSEDFVSSDVVSGEEFEQSSVAKSSVMPEMNNLQASLASESSVGESLQKSPSIQQDHVLNRKQGPIATDVEQSQCASRDQNNKQADEKLPKTVPEKPVAKTVKNNLKNDKQKLNYGMDCNIKETTTAVVETSSKRVSPSGVSKPNESWSIMKWFAASGKRNKEPDVIGGIKRGGKAKRKGRVNNNKSNNGNKQRNKTRSKLTNADKSTKVDHKEQPSDDITYTRSFWNKLIRAYRASMPLNIVLLICLAGVCVVPLMNKDACCELAQKHIPSKDFSLNQKPT